MSEPGHERNGHGSPPARAHDAVAAQATLSGRAREAVERSREAQARWRLEPLAARVAALTAAAKEMLRRRREIIETTHDELGKVEAEALFNEALGPLDAVKGWAAVVARAASPEAVRLNPVSFPRKSARIDLVPRGVVGVIAPWNYPVAGLYRSTLPALLTGNGLVLKPSEHAPRSTGWLGARLAEALPDGLVQVLQGDGAAGAALLEAGIDACVFTGSPATGKRVRVRCAELGIPCSAEMGGKDAAIVLADCDVPRTVTGITQWALSNAGQACGGIEIAYVDEHVADALVEGLARAWTKLRVGRDVGPIAHARQLEVVAAHVDDAKAKGAVVVCGGGPAGVPLGYLPTVLDRCTDKMKVVRDETFGPVLAVVRVSGAAEAVRRVNEGRYGLGASVWSRDVARAERIAERLEVGVAGVNCHGLSGAIPALPWSGTRETGFGVAGSAHSLATFVRPRATVVDRSNGRELYYMPYDDALVGLGEALADAQIMKLDRAWKIPLLIAQRLRTVRAFFR